MSRVFVAADWSQLETWLTAHFSGDPVMRAELEAQLKGGPKIHARNAAMIYGIDPGDAETYLVDFRGGRKMAYDAGKQAGHGFNYGMEEDKYAETYWVSREVAARHLGMLREKYAVTVEWRTNLANQVFGVFEYACQRCGFRSTIRGRCPSCSRPKWPMPLQYAGMAREPERVLYTPFGRRRLYPGRRKDGAKAAAAQLPQSCGNSMWMRSLVRLHGWDPYDEDVWPIPQGAVVWSPKLSVYGDLYVPMEVFVALGTYDSFAVECESRDAEGVGEWLAWTMEQPWPELGGHRFPVDLSIGKNWRKKGEGNPDGLAKVGYRAFTASAPR